MTSPSTFGLRLWAAVRQLFGPLEGGRWTAAIGTFALLAVGAHAAGDQLDDHVFVGINFLDELLDGFMGRVIAAVWPMFGVDKSGVARATYRASEWIGLQTKLEDAAILALAIELLVVWLVAVPLLRPLRSDRFEDLRGLGERLLRDPTILKVALPLSVAGAAIAGIVGVTRELHVAAFSLFADTLGTPVSVAGPIGRAVGLGTFALLFWFLALRAVVVAVVYADRRAELDRGAQFKLRTRRMRGWFVALVALPVVGLALLQGTPLSSTLAALVR